MSAERAFHRSLRTHVAALEDPPRTLPTAVAMACADTIPADGASLSLVSRHDRVPLGASDDEAAMAESLQFTAGDGPCMEAMRHDLVIDAPAPLLALRWAPLADLWHEHTSYRSAASLPLHLPGELRGSINLFFRHDRGGQDLHLVDVHCVATLAARVLTEWAQTSRPVDAAIPESLATERGQVWLAAGMLMQAGRTQGTDAVDLMRAWAYSHDTTVDDVAAQLADGRLEARLVLEGT